MKLSTVLRYHWLIALVLASICISIEARGGRRGGSSIGGLLGGLRKSKKHPSGSGNSRRTINGSPMHLSQSLTPNKQTRVRQQQNKQRPAHGSYPRQPMHAGNIDGPLMQQHLKPQHNALPPYTPPLPQGGIYYANPAALPSHAIYYAQPPTMHSSMGNDDFLTGLLVGNALTHRHRHHDHYVHHHYHERQQQQSMAQNATGQTIIIDNTNATGEGGTNVQVISPANEQAPRRRHKLPAIGHTPLAPFNTTLTPEELTQSSVTPIFRAHPQQQQPPALETSSKTPDSTAMPPPAYGIICVPILLNETDPHEPGKVQAVEKLVCYPAPPPPPPSAEPTLEPSSTLTDAPTTSIMGTPLASPTAAGYNALPLYSYDPYQQQQQLMAAAAAPLHPQCVMRTFVERDPTDATKTIEVLREYCNTATTQKVQVAGEINENNEHENVAASATPMLSAPTTTATSAITTANVAAMQTATTSSGATSLTGPTVATISARLQPFP